jgi:hypothetical protein
MAVSSVIHSERYIKKAKNPTTFLEHKWLCLRNGVKRERRRPCVKRIKEMKV